MAGISQKLATYLTGADRIITVIGTALVAIEATTGQLPVIGAGIAGLGIALSVIKYAEKEVSDPALQQTVDDVIARITALEESAKSPPQQPPSGTP